MENKLLAAIRRYGMLRPGDRVICAVSGGADSMALLWGMWMLREKLGITVEAAHFNHRLRGEESDRDEAFVRRFCHHHDIPLHIGTGEVTAGKKGLEAAAREARYAFLRSLGGTVATAHTADDNAETVLLHLLRGSALRGLGGITPVQPGLIRPMLDITRQEVEGYLQENWVSHITDSSNATDRFLRNRLRHHVMPLLQQENPQLCRNLSSMAQRLREDEQALQSLSRVDEPAQVAQLRAMEPALRRRALEDLLRRWGVVEPEARHIAQAENLVLCENPSAHARFPGGVTVRREYGALVSGGEAPPIEEMPLPPDGCVELEGLRICCHPAPALPGELTVYPRGPMVVRSRREGDMLTLSGGTKSVKKRLIDAKIPRHLRSRIPVIADEAGVLAVWRLGADCSRQSGGGVAIRFEEIEEKRG